MLEKVAFLEEKYNKIEEQLGRPELYDDPASATKLLKEQKELTPIVECYRAHCKAEADMKGAREMLDGKLDPDMRELAQEEFEAARADMARIENELKVLLLPTDPNDDKNVIVEIRGGAGGE
ncbi:MAG: PCRF domain-containing protein, partial [Clostridia bacterium]